MRIEPDHFNQPRCFLPRSTVLCRIAEAINVNKLNHISSAILIYHYDAALKSSKLSGRLDTAQHTAFSLADLTRMGFETRSILRAMDSLEACDIARYRKPNRTQFHLVFSIEFLRALATGHIVEPAEIVKPKRRAVHRLANLFFGVAFGENGFNWVDGNYAMREVKKTVKTKELNELGKWRKENGRPPLAVSDKAVFDELKIFRSWRARETLKKAPEETGAKVLNIAERIRKNENK